MARRTGRGPHLGESEQMRIEDGSKRSGVADRGHTADGVTGGCADGINICSAALFNAKSECQHGPVYAVCAAGQGENQLIARVKDHRLHDLINGTADCGSGLLGRAGPRRGFPDLNFQTMSGGGIDNSLNRWRMHRSSVFLPAQAWWGGPDLF